MVPGLIEGMTLEQLERESGIPLPPCELLRLADTMADALSAWIAEPEPLADRE